MAYDKRVHLFGSLIVCYLLSAVIVTWQAALVTLLLGAAKEIIYDKVLGKGTPEWGDMAADAAGVVLAIVARGWM